MSKSRKRINTKKGFHCICKQEISIGSVYKINENYYPKMFLEKYNNFNKDIEIYCNNSYNVDSDEGYYDEKCAGLFLETARKI